MKYSIIVVGAGGTGSYFLKEVSRFLQGNGSIAGLYVYDGDVVEKKNLARQSFMSEDVGRNKAAVMAEALNEAFGLSWMAFPHYVNKADELISVASRRGSYGEAILPILVCCADNHAVRLLMEEAFGKLDNAAYFDSANEFTTGEVVYAYRVNKKTLGPARTHYFPDVKKGDLRGREEMSCTELNAVEPQHIFTNMLAGNLLCTGVSNLLAKKSTPGVAYFNASRMDCRFVPYVPAEKPEKPSAERRGRGRKKKAEP
ncbi:MAG: ThiF family adenylyltransferase [Lachnospiraceae bacterium]|nr:ThiF family adenylyltransferase [Lachnospiraceae bacterium]